MSIPVMVVTTRRRPHRTTRRRAAGGLLVLLLMVIGMLGGPPAMAGTPSGEPGDRALLCRPEPPDYPGCSPAQVRPLERARFAREYRGHEPGYRYFRMGQHHRGVIFAHLRPALDAKLARLYRAAVTRYAAHHTRVIVDKDGIRHVVVTYPRFPTWAGFKAHATALCNAGTVSAHFPSQYCWSVTKIGQAGAVINAVLNRTTSLLFACNGFAVGGWASGSFAAWKLGTGVLAGGYYGAASVEIGCQTTNLWNWATHLW